MEYQQIIAADFHQYKDFFRHQRYELCTYSLTAITAWSTDEYQPYGAIDGDSLILYAEYSTRKELRHLILPVSPVREYGPAELHALAGALDLKTVWFVPENYVTKHRREISCYFTVTEQTGYGDYIYLTSDLLELKGNRYSKKRNLIKQFLHGHAGKNRLRFERISSANMAHCIDFIEEWCKAKNCEPQDNYSLACEKQAAMNAVKNIEQVASKGVLLRIDGVVSAIGISSYLTDEMGVLHFEKAFENIKGLYQYFDQACIRMLLAEYKYVNKESDMDDPGLAQSKKSYHPVKKVRSYQLEVKR